MTVRWTRWLAETRAVFETLTEGPQILVGSSMAATWPCCCCGS
jgi:hypothetical protein